MRHESEYYQYLPGPDSTAARLGARQRTKMFQNFITQFGLSPDQTVVDIGVTNNKVFELDNYFEILYPRKDKITAVGLEDASYLEKAYPGLRFVQVRAGPLPFDDNEFDVAHASAVIEHVGGRENQVAFLAELWRVARKGLFVTTPNRWFPIEFHTMLPVLHWLPPPTFRLLLDRLGYGFFANERNLNLLTGRSLQDAARAAGIARPVIDHVSLGGWPTNLLLIGHKDV